MARPLRYMFTAKEAYMRFFVPVLFLALSACPEPIDNNGENGIEPEPAPENLDSELDRTGGCSDIVMYRFNDDDTLALIVSGQGLVEAAYQARDDDAAESTSTTVDLSTDTELTVELHQGENVTHQLCNDALEFEVVVDRTYVAVEGTALLTLTPTAEVAEPWAMPADAVLDLTDVVLEADDGTQVELDTFAIEVDVGWMPG